MLFAEKLPATSKTNESEPSAGATLCIYIFQLLHFFKDADHSNFRMILAIFILSQFSSCAKEMTKSSVGSDHRADPEVTVTASVAHV